MLNHSYGVVENDKLLSALKNSELYQKKIIDTDGKNIIWEWVGTNGNVIQDIVTFIENIDGKGMYKYEAI